MKNLSNLLGIIVFITIIVFSMVGCDLPKTEFPFVFVGTWERDYVSAYTNTLTFTSNSIKDSTQSFYWDLQKVSGNNYTLKSTNMDTVYTIYINYENGSLNFGMDNTNGEHDWQGKWRRKNDNGGNNNGGDDSGKGNGGIPSGTVTTSTTSEGIVLSGNANLAAKLAWLDRNADSHNTYIVEVNANNNIAPYTFSYSGAINITVILRGVGGNQIIRLTSNGTMFTVKANVILILDDNITLQGHSQNTGNMVNVEGGILRMNTGATITGNTGYGGVYVSSGTFEMTGGTISGNGGERSTSFLGAGVDVRGTFNMSGGTISGNTASEGGGVYVGRSGTFSMSDGIISGNTAINNGGGVNVSGDYNSSFTMSGGTISGNTATKCGGGVYHNYNYGIFTMNGGIISGNIASEYGGGVYIDPYYFPIGSFNKTAGTIIGYNSDSINGNVVKDSSGVLARRGHAVYLGTSSVKRKETTAGPEDNLSLGSGAWDE